MKKNKFIDDGRVIVNMNVEGMPFYKEKKEKPLNENYYSKREIAKFVFYSVLAALSVVAIFSVVLVLFILFCTKIWFK